MLVELTDFLFVLAHLTIVLELLNLLVCEHASYSADTLSDIIKCD